MSGWPRRWLLAPHPWLIAALVACTPGAYPVDLFGEMHYQPSQRRLEPERSAPPDGAVPTTAHGRPGGARPPGVVTGTRRLSFEQARALTNPLPATAETLGRARRLYARDCLTCHGQRGDGQGPMAEHLRREQVEPPTPFASGRVRARADGELHWILGHGLGGMPPFGELLTDEERWLLVLEVRELGGR